MAALLVDPRETTMVVNSVVKKAVVMVDSSVDCWAVVKGKTKAVLMDVRWAEMLAVLKVYLWAE